MKVVRESVRAGRLTYTAVPEKYDGIPPITRFVLDHGPGALNQEREAVVCYLLFGQWTGGALKLPQGVGPATATAIERAADPVPVRPETVAYHPKSLAMGDSTLVVREGAPAGASDGAAHDKDLWVLRSDEWSGSLRTHRGIAVASNYFAFRTAADPDGVRALLATAMLYAEDLDADTVLVPGLPDDALVPWRPLFAVTRLLLRGAAG